MLLSDDGGCAWISRVFKSADLDLPHPPSPSSPHPLELITAGIGSVPVVVIARCTVETDTRSNEAAAAEAAAMTAAEMATAATTEMATGAVTSTAMISGSKRGAAAADRHCGYSYNC
jgi:hypothetical protein